MKYSILILVLIGLSWSCMSQQKDTLDLFDCHRSAVESHPYFRGKSLYIQSKDIREKNISANWYPSLDLNGRYTWQNEVVSLPFPDLMPGLNVPEMPHYNYKLTLDIQQTLYDGGFTRASRELEESSLLVNQQQLDVSLHKIKEQINQVYFHILVLQQQEITFHLKMQVLEKKMQMIESGVRNEIFSTTDQNVMKAEILMVEQQLTEIRIAKSSGLKILENLTYRNIPEDAVLGLPVVNIFEETDPKHPEQILFDLRMQQLDASKNLLSKQRQPRAYVFGQLGYGNPALDFFRDEFRSYYIVGAGLRWTIWDWNKSSREREDLAVQQEIIRSRKNAFNQGLTIKKEENLAEISKYEEAVQRDREIVNIRQEIRMAATSQHENGIITTSDYIRELNAETEARIKLILHSIQLVQAKISYLTAQGYI